MARSIELTTRDLVLRELTMDDWPAAHTYASQPVVVQHELWGPNDEAATRAFVQRAIDEQGCDPRRVYELAITLASGELIGGAGLRLGAPEHREADIGYVIHPAHWGRGHATQAARALVAFGFDELGLHRITATCGARNAASARVLTKVGMRPEGVLREHRRRQGRWADTLLFAILESDPRPA